jgi:flavin-dependent dehydrogenase
MYDIIVIGAGPTGCTAAKTLSDKGFKVLVVEKFEMPRYKSCSGILIKKSIDLIHHCFGDTVPAFSMCAPTENKGMIFTNDKGKEFRFEQPGLNVWRGSFDNWLAEKARKSGAEIRDCTTALSCKEDDEGVAVTLHGVQTNTEKARYVLDCEGVVGSIKRKTAKDAAEYITTYQTFNHGSIRLDFSYFYAYLQPELSEYDAWFNVKDNLLVFGVAVKDVGNIDCFYARFLEYMKKHHDLHIDRQAKEEKWLMPRIQPGCPIDYGIGRVLYAGEVAGFLNPMGEGISAGMESGYFAACAIANNFDDTDRIYADYRQSTEGLRVYMKRQWNFVAGMADTFAEMKLC